MRCELTEVSKNSLLAKKTCFDHIFEPGAVMLWPRTRKEKKKREKSYSFSQATVSNIYVASQATSTELYSGLGRQLTAKLMFDHCCAKESKPF